MEGEVIHILLIEDNVDDADLIMEYLRDAEKDEGSAVFRLERVSRLALGLEKIREGDFDIVLTDLGLPDSRGLEALRKIKVQASGIPTIVLTGEDNDALGIEAVREGSQDYLPKATLDGRLLARSIRYAIQRHRVEVELRQHRDHLEEMVQDRTTELVWYNEQLQREMNEREQAQQKFANILELAADAIIATDRDCQIILFNKSAEHIFGYRSEEVIGKPFNMLMPAAFNHSHRKKQQKSGKSPEIVHHDFNNAAVRGRRKNGEEFPAEFSISKTDQDDGVIFTIIIRDISELVRAQEAYRVLVQYSLQGLIIFQNDRIVFANPTFAEMVGYTVDELLFLSPAELRELLSPEDQSVIVENAQSRIKGQPGKMQHEIAVKRKQGTLRKMEIYAAPVEYNGQNAVQVAFIDITERERVQQEFANILELAADAIIAAGGEGRITLFNRSAESIFGYGADEAVKLSINEMLPDVPFGPGYAGSRHLTTTARRKDGSEFPAEVSISDSQRGGQFTVIVRDITERQRVEEMEREQQQLRLKLEKEREVNDLRSRFVSMVSHEFRTPLATIQATAGMLHDYHDRMSPEDRELRFQKIHAQVQHMTDMLEDVLMIGKMAADAIPFHPQPMNLIPFCREMVEEFRSMHDSHHFALETPHAATCYGLCRNLQADEKLIRQIISNLLQNAVKYSPPGSTIIFSIGCEGSQRVIIRVSDEGIGIPEKDRRRIFQTFYRAGNVGLITGTGLGLAITKRAVEMHGGTITFESTIGKGTIFTVTLPLRTYSLNERDF
jgi:PAS domain S-box-containing protein